MADLKFYKKASAPSSITEGGIWFDTTNHIIKVKTATGYDSFGGVIDATLADSVLTITKADSSQITLDFSDVASASETMSVFEQLNNSKADKTNNVTKTAAATTTGYIPKFTDTAGTIANGYSVQTSLTSSSTAIPNSAAVVAAIDNKIAAADAMIYKGTLGTSGTITTVPTTKYKTGWTYKVITAGTYAGVKCEVGDMLIAINDGPSSGTSVVNADWTVVQTNIDGAVTGPASSTDSHVAVFSGTTGKVIEDSGFTISKSVPSNAVFTDTKVTTVGNHYIPSGGTAAATTAGSAVSAGGKVITAITVDAAGHVTGATTGTIPAAPTLSGLGGVGTVTATGTTPLTLKAAKSGTTVTLTGSVAEMTGASSSKAGTSGLVPAPSTSEYTKYLRGDGTWGTPTNTIYTHPAGNAASKTLGFYKFSTDSNSHINSVTAVAKTDLTSLIGSNTYDTYGAATNALTSAKAYANDLMAWTEFD